MNIENKLNHLALKYNWWSHKKDLKDLSLTKKIEYILKFGNLKEILFVKKHWKDEA